MRKYKIVIHGDKQRIYWVQAYNPLRAEEIVRQFEEQILYSADAPMPPEIFAYKEPPNPEWYEIISQENRDYDEP